MTTSVDDPPVAREEPSHSLANASFLIALVGCTGVAVVVSAAMAVVVLRRGRRTGDDHGSIAAVGALALDVLWVLLLGFVTAMAATGQFGISHGQRDHTGQVTRPEQLSVFALQTGDCFDSADYVPGGPADGTASAPGIALVTIKPCSQSHQLEVYDDVAAEGGRSYPGAAALNAQAERICSQAFAGYVGSDPTHTRLKVLLLYPTSLIWRDADLRRISCVVRDPSGPVSTSLRGSRR